MKEQVRYEGLCPSCNANITLVFSAVSNQRPPQGTIRLQLLEKIEPVITDAVKAGVDSNETIPKFVEEHFPDWPWKSSARPLVSVKLGMMVKEGKLVRKAVWIPKEGKSNSHWSTRYGLPEV